MGYPLSDPRSINNAKGPRPNLTPDRVKTPSASLKRVPAGGGPVKLRPMPSSSRSTPSVVAKPTPARGMRDNLYKMEPDKVKTPSAKPIKLKGAGYAGG